jgi:uncharacterized protein
MKLASEFPVPAPPGKVFSLFFDPDTMRACIPGAAELERVDDSTYRGRLVNEVAHVRFSAAFSAEIQSTTEPAGGTPGEVRAVLKGEDRKLGSSIKIDARLTVRPGEAGPESSVIGYEMELALWGKLGRLGEPIIRRRSREVELEFAKSLARVAGGGPAKQPAPNGKPVAAAPAATTQPEVTSPVRKVLPVAAAAVVLAALVAWLRRR